MAPRLGRLKRDTSDTTGSSHSGRLASDFSTFPLASDIIYIPSLGVTGHYNKWPPVKLPHLLLLLSLAQHHYTFDLLFPHHPPEVIDSVWEGPLTRYVGSLLPVTLYREGNTSCGILVFKDTTELVRCCGVVNL